MQDLRQVAVGYPTRLDPPHTHEMPNRCYTMVFGPDVKTVREDHEPERAIWTTDLLEQGGPLTLPTEVQQVDGQHGDDLACSESAVSSFSNKTIDSYNQSTLPSSLLDPGLIYSSG